MKFLKNNAYWILGVVIGIGISTVILMQRGDQQDVETTQQGPSAKPEQQGIAQFLPKIDVKPPPPGETAESGFWHGDHWHKTPHVQTSVRGTQKGVKRKPSLIARIDHRPGHQPIIYSQEQYIQIGKWRRMMEAGEITPEEYAEKKLELTVGDMDTESAVRFYEKHRTYNSALLAQLDTFRAFKYLKSIAHPAPSSPADLKRREEIRMHANRVLAETVSDSTEHFEAKLYLADTDPDFSRAVTLYRELLESDPDSQYILTEIETPLPVRRHIYVHLGDRLWRDHPEEAIPYLKMAVHLDEQHGDYPLMSNHILGEAYERIGDYKTAWVYHKRAYKKTGHWSPRAHFRAIEAGKPLHEPLRHAERDRPQGSKSVEAWDAFVKDTPETFQMDSEWEKDRPGQDTSPGDKSSIDSERARAAQQARAEFLKRRERAQKEFNSSIDSERARAAQQARAEFLKRRERAQKEFNDFLQWMESIENAAPPIDTNNFLIKEMVAPRPLMPNVLFVPLKPLNTTGRPKG